MLKTFLSELTTQSKTAFSLGTLLIVLRGLSTLRTLRDLMVLRFCPVELPLTSNSRQNTVFSCENNSRNFIFATLGRFCLFWLTWTWRPPEHNTPRWHPECSRNLCSNCRGEGQRRDQQSENDWMETLLFLHLIDPVFFVSTNSYNLPLKPFQQQKWWWTCSQSRWGSCCEDSSPPQGPRLPGRWSWGRWWSWWECRRKDTSLRRVLPGGTWIQSKKRI